MKKNYINQLPIPACIVGTDDIITQTNPLMSNVFLYDNIVGSNFFALTGIKREALLSANEGDLFIERNERKFKIRVNEDVKENADIVVFFDEATAREAFRKRLEDESPVIVFLNIDNYDELIASSTEDYKRVLPSQIDGIVRKWGEAYDSPVMRMGEEQYVMYSNHGNVKRMIEDNFSVLDEVRKIESQIDFPASISIGIGMSSVSMMESTELAEAALELALGRGGDQAVVKDDEHTSYYGGTLQAVEKNNRGKSRVIAHAMKTLIKDADRVYIMGHRWPDMDSFGSAIGAYCICRHLGTEAFIVVDKHNDALDTIYDQAEASEDYQIIKPEKALKQITPGSLLIIVDTNRPMLVESEELLNVCTNRIIIDHHRMTEDSIQNATVAYIESYASSASELMAELLQHFSPKRFINKFEAEAMLAGIMVDSNNFSGRTGVRTFEAASWLKRAGADTTEVKRFFQMDKVDFKSKASAIAHADFTDEGVAYAATRGHTGNTQIINAQVADELLMVKGVRASFVLGTNEKEQTIISARSLGDVNVQSMMERFGGGGHFTSAAAQVNEPLDYVEDQLRKTVKEYLEKESQEKEQR